MTNEELELIRKRAEVATAGPWLKEFTHGIKIISESKDVIGDDEGVIRYPDAEFIAHAREDVPKLLAEIERLRKTLDYINDLSSEFFTECDGDLTYSIPDTTPHKSTLQEIFVISHEAVNADDSNI